MMGEMKPLVMSIRRNYGLEIYEMIAHRKDWVLDTNQGRFRLKAISYSEAEALFHYSIYQHIKEKGFHSIVDVLTTRDGKPYITTEEGLFQIIPWEDYDFINYESPEMLNEVVHTMALFHQFSIDFEAIPGSKIRTEWGRWPWVFQAYTTLGGKVRQQIREKHHREKTEKGILEGIDRYLEQANDCIAMLKEIPYLDMVRESMEKRELCINNFNKKSFVKVQGHPLKMACLEDAKHDMHAVDVANLILANMEQVESAKEIIRIYHEHYPLKDDEIKMIQAYIQFPHEYFKFIERYYKNRNSGSDSYWSKKLKKILKIEKLQKSFSNLDLCKVVKIDA
ncbi:CotS family spore coat protein [Anaerosolibacter carboniphilus]|uniref:CotS family spore coat protein n=1 Tax=Anaerosolibacter carboniphilus TaxID=1417629 RepID=A0A841KU34_9FIRM|nr:CotS family spore coat protein [Anaerosolibacter carboniphilus]MBB6215540.1 CotS family spore coat protein [Anaerosolibacter carboniphilus]